MGLVAHVLIGKQHKGMLIDQAMQRGDLCGVECDRQVYPCDAGAEFFVQRFNLHPGLLILCRLVVALARGIGKGEGAGSEYHRM